MSLKKLYWRMIPMYAVAPYSQMYGKDAFYYPYLGKGVYSFLICTTTNKYIIWYIGESMDLGKRWFEHVKNYLNPPQNYWFPKNPDAFLNDPIAVINNDAYIQQAELSDEEKTSYSIREIIKQSYYCYAELPTANKTELEEVESALFKTTKEYLGIRKNGWIGDRSSQRKAPIDLIVENVFEKPYIKETLGQSLPLYTNYISK